jgi:hypothetical protein
MAVAKSTTLRWFNNFCRRFTTSKVKKAIGRPTISYDELIDEICARLSAGESLNRILKSRSEMPAFITIYQWLRKYPEFTKQYSTLDIQLSSLRHRNGGAI